ncbi:MAG: hypothetical protein PHG13_01825, partial [Candidatus Pacebacteria bacterium]|nr:hypothetical protein [Candidatus Paceibacterota bacterium]
FKQKFWTKKATKKWWPDTTKNGWLTTSFFPVLFYINHHVILPSYYKHYFLKVNPLPFFSYPQKT